MFIIENNQATAVAPQTFTGLGFRERDHLQEWIAENPTLLGEELLIIQKEFRGFDKTSERLDLLALDKDGNLVIIENKRDDSGADVTWQALKYVSYCSTLTAEEIVQIFQQYLGDDKSAEAELRTFFDEDDFATILDQGDQRIILVAANFRSEVTSTVMWLLDRDIKIKCIKVTPYKHGENIFIVPEQIIPVKDAEEYLIRFAQKRQAQTIAVAKGTRLSSKWSFSEMDIPKGAELTYKPDPTKKCKVYDDEQMVEYENKVCSLVDLAKELSHGSGIKLPAPKLFAYNGKRLLDIRHEKMLERGDE